MVIRSESNNKEINSENSYSDIVVLEPQIHLNNFNIFDLGSNKNVFNKGLINHEIRTKIPEKINSLFGKSFDNSSKKTVLIPGFVLSQLVSEDSKSLDILKNKVSDGSVILSSAPFFRTSSTILSDKELKSEIKKHESLLKTVFGKESSVVVLDNEASEKLINAFPNKKFIVHNRLQNSQLQNKLIVELKKIKPFLFDVGDNLLINDFHLLTNNQIISRIDESKASVDSSPYEEYSAVMNILNDFVNRINNFKTSEEGIVNDIQLSESPSSLIIQ